MIAVHSESQEIPFRSPFETFRRIREVWGEQGTVLLESLAGPARDARTSLVAFGPVLTVSITGTLVDLTGREAVAKQVGEQLIASSIVAREGQAFRMGKEADLWRVMRTVANSFSCPPGVDYTFQFGFIGYLGYDVVRGIEKLPYRIPPGNDPPTLALTVYEGTLDFDLVRKSATLRVHHAPGFWNSTAANKIKQIMSEVPADDRRVDSELNLNVPRPIAVKDTIRREEYLQKVRQALHYISIGDIYQVQLGHELEIRTDALPLDVYQRLRARNPSPYMYVLPVGDLTMVGASPESFVKIEGRQITMRPIAGTIRRGATPEEDAELARKLKSDEKEVAEHVMLVDLCRNDIGRVCEPNTLDANELLFVERYSHVNHLVSNVRGTLRRDVDAFDAIAATFPAGTMTGAPKIRAMEIIEELENTRRGIYAGAVGYIDFTGYTNMALCIRSAVVRAGCYRIRASAGVVADSVPEKEWNETLHKMGAPYWAIAGEELK